MTGSEAREDEAVKPVEETEVSSCGGISETRMCEYEPTISYDGGVVRSLTTFRSIAAGTEPHSLLRQNSVGRI
jgi:hypothetical protein